MAIALYLAYLKKQEALIMLNQAKVCHCESMELEKSFQKKQELRLQIAQYSYKTSIHYD